MPTPQTVTKNGTFFTTSGGDVAADQLEREVNQNANITIKLLEAPAALPGGGASFLFADTLPGADETELEAVCAAHTAEGLLLAPVTKDGKPRIQQDPREGEVREFYSLNWCDRTTWWCEAKKVVSATMRPTADPLVFEFVDTDGTTGRGPIIDPSHGKITQEHAIAAEYAPKLEVASDLKVEQEFGYDPSVVAADGRTMVEGDYVIDYSASPATATFFSAPSETPVATYYYAYSSGWIFSPEPGMKLDLLAVETGLSLDIEQNDTVIYQPQIMAAAAAASGMIPATLLMSQGGSIMDTDYIDIPIPNPTATSASDLVPDPARRHEYKNIEDFLSESQRLFPSMPKIGTNARSMLEEQLIMRWPYGEQARRELASSQYVRLRVFLKYDQPFSGKKAMMSVYALSEEDV